jgi:hypothetical protein
MTKLYSFISILEPIIRPRQDENIVQASPDKIPSFISLQPDEKPADRVAQPFEEMTVSIEHPEKEKPRAISEDKPTSLVNGKPGHDADEPSRETPLMQFDVKIPLNEGETPVKINQKPLEPVR